MNSIDSAVPAMAGHHARALLQLLATWGNTTTIVLHGGCVFEFKGVFPKGSDAEGFYNLESAGDGFHGHINLAVIDRITFQARPHRGRESYAFVFEDKAGGTVFKVFLGRDAQGALHADQVAAFKQIQQQLAVLPAGDE